ncbi:hypothetical protein [Paraburkholderia caffeinitolerans]|uniref:hypothetical protein n=1 Tax=Paraburkholderia caffeinitolerans TaxID=1723730 RepID=UPI001583A927|nr:hypothetical protein [Paraburkholderia caffeinitolerans]
MREAQSIRAPRARKRLNGEMVIANHAAESALDARLAVKRFEAPAHDASPFARQTPPGHDPQIAEVRDALRVTAEIAIAHDKAGNTFELLAFILGQPDLVLGAVAPV